MPPADLEELVEGALDLHPHSVARLVSIFQDRRPDAAASRARVIALLDERQAPVAPVIGITGTPGSGKSSLVGRIAVDLIESDPDLSVAVLAVDPSSQVSGGALLGDRTRLQVGAADHRLYFRSEASDTELGGLSPSTFQVIRLLTRLFRSVIVETVGIGQSEGDIRRLAEYVYLVIAPHGGDQVQFLKAGIIEIPDAFVLNKWDVPGSEVGYRQLRSSLWLARPFDAEETPIFRTSAKTGVGLDDLREAVAARIRKGPDDEQGAREAYFFERWVRTEWGRRGVVALHEAGGASAEVERHGGFDLAQRAFDPASNRASGPASNPASGTDDLG
ncbi:MAG: methylmalonyl Co-A mutase-associated GTPase MeaB [Nocardioides sp.]|uniref:methylmalonyl Co-A mutase-associated GTPase MeaB n=1 Tax=Nocardioides sp. TaxID=35761 RepID=UPI0039E2E709